MHRGRRFLRILLRVPFFHKILLANAALLVVAGAVVAAVLVAVPAAARDLGPWGAVGVAMAAALLPTGLLNAVLVRLALSPLRQVEETARRVQDGDLDARVAASPLADAELDRLTTVFNRMLDSLGTLRRRQAALTARALEAEEAERKRIAHELFSDTAQRLSTLLLYLRTLERAPDVRRSSLSLESIREEVVSTLEGVRRIARGLRPPELDELGAVAALEAYARKGPAAPVPDGSGLQVAISGHDVDRYISPEAGLALYRIFQEALTNAIRHAEATRIEVRFTLRDGEVEAVLEDDGRGFDVDAALERSHRSLGLLSMYERASLAQGRLEMESRPGMGTRVRLHFPSVVNGAEGPSSFAAAGARPTASALADRPPPGGTG